MSTKMTSTLWRGKAIFRSLAKFKQHKIQRNNHLKIDYKLGKLQKRNKTNETAEASSCNEIIKNDDETKKEAEDHEEENNACKPSTETLTITDVGKVDECSNRHFPNISVYYVNEFESTHKQIKITKPTVIAIGAEIISGDDMLNNNATMNVTSRKEPLDELEENPLQSLKYVDKYKINYKQYKEEKCPYDKFLQKHNFTIGYPTHINMFVKPKSKNKISGTQGFQEDERKTENKIQSEEDQNVITELVGNEILQNKSETLNYQSKHDNFNKGFINDTQCIDSKIKDSLKSIKINSNGNLENASKNYKDTDENRVANDEFTNRPIYSENTVENDFIKFKIPQNSYTKGNETKHLSELLPGKSNESLNHIEEKENFKKSLNVEAPHSNLDDENLLDDKSLDLSQHLTKIYNLCEYQHLKYFRMFKDSRKYFSTTKSKSVDDISLLVYKGISKRHLKAAISSILGNDSEKEIVQEHLPINKTNYMGSDLHVETSKAESLNLKKSPTNKNNDNSQVESLDFEKSINDNSKVENNLSMYSYSSENYKVNEDCAYENYIPLKLLSRAVPFKSNSESNLFKTSDYKRSLQMRLRANQSKLSSSTSNKRRRKIKYRKESRHQGIIISPSKTANSISKKGVSDSSQNLDKQNNLTKSKYNIPNAAIETKQASLEENSIRPIIKVQEKIGEEIDNKISEIFKAEKKETTVKASGYLSNTNSYLSIKNLENDIRDSKKSAELIDRPQKGDNMISHHNENLSKCIPNKEISSNYEFQTHQLKEMKKMSGPDKELPPIIDSEKMGKRIKNEKYTLKKSNSIKHDSTKKEASIYDIKTATYDIVSIDPNKLYDSSQENFYKYYNRSFGSTDSKEQSKKKYRHYINERVDNFQKRSKKMKLKTPLPLLPNQNRSFSNLRRKYEKVNKDKKNTGTVAIRSEGKRTPKIPFTISHTSTKSKSFKPISNRSNDENQNHSVKQFYFKNNRNVLALKKENLSINPDSKLLKYVSNVKKYIISGIPKSYDFKDLEKFYKNLRTSLKNKTSDEQLKSNMYFLVPKHTPRKKLHQTYKLKSKNMGMNSFSDIKSKIKYNRSFDGSVKNVGLTPTKDETQNISGNTFINTNQLFLSKQRRELQFINKDKKKSGDNSDTYKAKFSSPRIFIPENSHDKEINTLHSIKPPIRFSQNKFYANVSKHDEDVLTASDILYKQRKNTLKSGLNGSDNVLSSEQKKQNRIETSKSTILDQSKFNRNINRNSSSNIDKYKTHTKQQNNHNDSIIDNNDLSTKSKYITPKVLSANNKITKGKTRDTLGSRVNNNTYINNDKQLSIKVRQNGNFDIGQKLPEYEKSIDKPSKTGSNQPRSKSSISKDFTKIISKTDIGKPSLKHTVHKLNIKKGMNDITKELHLIKTDILNTIKNINSGKFSVESKNATDIITDTFRKRLNLLKKHSKNFNENYYGNKSDSEIEYEKKYETKYANLKKNYGSDDFNYYTLKNKTKNLKTKIPNRYDINNINFFPDKKLLANLKKPDTKSVNEHQSKSEIDIDMLTKFKKLRTNSSINLQNIKTNVKAKNSFSDRSPYKTFSDFSSKVPVTREYHAEENIVAIPKIHSKKSHSSYNPSVNIPSNNKSSIYSRFHGMSDEHERISDQKFGYNSKKYTKRDYNKNIYGSKTLPIPKKQYKNTIKDSNIHTAKSQESQFTKTGNTLDKIKNKIKTNLTPFEMNMKKKEIPKPLLKNDINNISTFDDSCNKNCDVSMNVKYKIAFSPDTFYLNNPIEKSIRNNEMNLTKPKDKNDKIDYNSINIYQNPHEELKRNYSYSEKYSNKSTSGNNKNRNNVYSYEKKKY